MRFSFLAITLLTSFGLFAQDKKPPIQSMVAMTFSPAGTLFVADSIGAKIFAFDLSDVEANTKNDPRNVPDLGKVMGDMLGIPAADVLIHDMAVHPKSQEIYFSVSRGRSNWDTAWKTPGEIANALILIKMDLSGKLSEVKIDTLKSTWVEVENPISPDQKTFTQTSKRSFAITDMVFHENELYVAGLSNQEFSSTMRIFPFPFSDKKAHVTSLEIYHGAHGMYETNAPIRTFTIMPIKDEPHLVAAYLCTPIAVFKIADLKANKHLRGRTVAEIGMGNFPIDMIRINNAAGDRVLMNNSHYRRTVFTRQALEAYSGTIDTEVTGPHGMEHRKISGINILQMDMLNPEYLLALKLEPSGVINLLSEKVRQK